MSFSEFFLFYLPELEVYYCYKEFMDKYYLIRIMTISHL